MAKRKVIWTKKALFEMVEIMNYYANRNKSRIYSAKLQKEIKQIIKDLDFSVALPKKTSVENLFYFTHKHNSVFFSVLENNIFIESVWDERQNPQNLDSFLNEMS